MVCVADYIPDTDEIRRILHRLLAAMAPGSFLTISHAASDIDPDQMAEMIRCLNEHLAQDSHTGRPRHVVTRFPHVLDLVRPGVVNIARWQP